MPTCDDLRGCDGLSHVAQRVLRPMKQQAHDRRRQLRPADGSSVGERRLGGGAQLSEGTLDGIGEAGDQALPCARLSIRFALRGESGLLLGRQPLAARIRKQPVEASTRVSRVKSNRRGAGGPGPDLLGCQALERSLQFFTRLEKAVGNGLQERRNSGHSATKPDFGLTR